MLVSLLLLPARACGIWAAKRRHFVEQGSSSVNGAKEILKVGNNGKYTSYINFDLFSLPEDVTSNNISKATLKLFVSKGNKPGPFDIHVVNGNWFEATLRSSNAPGTTFLATIPVSASDLNQYFLLDVTDVVKSWINDDSNFGIALVPTSGSQLDMEFDSKEAKGTSHDPGLDQCSSNSY